MTEAGRFWSARPYRRLGWREGSDGRVVVLRPRLGEGWLGHWFGGLLRDPYYRIRLDEFGTFVWKACDGETSLEVIAQRMQQRFGRDVEPADERVGQFVQTMVSSRLITVCRDS